MFDGNRVLVWEMERTLEMDGGDGCTTMGMHVVPLNCNSKIVHMKKFYGMCISPKFLKIGK